MKKVIFLCLLSLSVCLSKPAENQAAPTSPPVKPVETKPNVTESSHLTPTATETVTKEPAKVSTPVAAPTSPPKEATAAPTKETTPTESAKPTEDNNTPKENVPNPKETVPNANTTKVTTEKAVTGKPEEGKPKNGTKTDTKDASTLKPTDAATKATEAPKSDKDAHIVQARGFDGPSFIGGIILTLGLLAIGFMGFKYYKNQTERNYHTL